MSILTSRVNLDAAGIDIGAESIVAAVPKGRTPEGEHVRTFQSFVCSLRELANWLKACGVCTVAMESTGVYWIPLYELLEDEGFEVYLVDARKVKNVSGRKSGRVGCGVAATAAYIRATPKNLSAGIGDLRAKGIHPPTKLAGGVSGSPHSAYAQSAQPNGAPATTRPARRDRSHRPCDHPSDLERRARSS